MCVCECHLSSLSHEIFQVLHIYTSVNLRRGSGHKHRLRHKTGLIYPKREMVRFSERTTQATADKEDESKNLKDHVPSAHPRQHAFYKNKKKEIKSIKRYVCQFR